jgi:cell wall-associated NlpC family hydrolase
MFTIAFMLALAGVPAPTPVAASPANPAPAHQADLVQQQVANMLADRTSLAERASRAAGEKTHPPVTTQARARPVKPAAAKPATAAKYVTSRAQKVIAFARRQLGKPYRWAAAGPNAYDCSGLAMAAYATVGIRLPHQTGGIITMGKKVSRSQMRPGDLVFLSSSHVGIYIGGGMMIHAPHTGDVVRVAAVYAFTTARRLL